MVAAGAAGLCGHLITYRRTRRTDARMTEYAHEITELINQRSAELADGMRADLDEMRADMAALRATVVELSKAIVILQQAAEDEVGRRRFIGGHESAGRNAN